MRPLFKLVYRSHAVSGTRIFCRDSLRSFGLPSFYMHHNACSRAIWNDHLNRRINHGWVVAAVLALTLRAEPSYLGTKPHAGLPPNLKMTGSGDTSFCVRHLGRAVAMAVSKSCSAVLFAGAPNNLGKTPSAAVKAALLAEAPVQAPNLSRVSALVEQLGSKDPVAKTVAAWALHDLAKGQPFKNMGDAVWEAEGVIPLVAMLSPADSPHDIAAASAIGQLASANNQAFQVTDAPLWIQLRIFHSRTGNSLSALERLADGCLLASAPLHTGGEPSGELCHIRRLIACSQLYMQQTSWVLLGPGKSNEG